MITSYFFVSTIKIFVPGPSIVYWAVCQSNLFLSLLVVSHFLVSSIRISLDIYCTRIITAQVNAIIKNKLNFENDHNIPLTLYYKYIDLRIKDIDVIMLVLDNMELRLIYTNLILYYRQWLT